MTTSYIIYFTILLMLISITNSYVISGKNKLGIPGSSEMMLKSFAMLNTKHEEELSSSTRELNVLKGDNDQQELSKKNQVSNCHRKQTLLPKGKIAFPGNSFFESLPLQHRIVGEHFPDNLDIQDIQLTKHLSGIPALKTCTARKCSSVLPAFGIILPRQIDVIQDFDEKSLTKHSAVNPDVKVTHLTEYSAAAPDFQKTRFTKHSTVTPDFRETHLSKGSIATTDFKDTHLIKNSAEIPYFTDTYLSKQSAVTPDFKETYLSEQSTVTPDFKETYLSKQSAVTPDFKETYLSKQSAVTPDFKATYLPKQSALIPDFTETYLLKQSAAIPDFKTKFLTKRSVLITNFKNANLTKLSTGISELNTSSKDASDWQYEVPLSLTSASNISKSMNLPSGYLYFGLNLTSVLKNNTEYSHLKPRNTSESVSPSSKNTPEFPHYFPHYLEFSSENSHLHLNNSKEHSSYVVTPEHLSYDLGNASGYSPFNSQSNVLQTSEDSSYHLKNTSGDNSLDLMPAQGHVYLKRTITGEMASLSLTQISNQGTTDFGRSLQRLLAETFREELAHCDTIVIIDRTFSESRAVEDLLQSDNLKQILMIQDPKDFEMRLLWTSPRCQGIFIFLSSPDFLFKFSDEALALWDYTARVIIIGLEEKDLQVFSQTRKAKKTEQIIGIVNGETEGHLKIYRNELYWGRRTVIKIADWRGDSFVRRPTFFPNKVSDLRQVVLNVSTFEYPPATIYRRSSNGSLLFKYGRDISLVQTLAEVFNFSVSFKEPGPGELWGRIHPNGSWDGIVGFLARGEADIAVANIYMTALLGRSELQEYSSPYTSDIGCVVSRKDQPLPQWLSPVRPFHPVTWAVFFVGLLISGPLLSFFGKASDHIGTENPNFQSLAMSCLYAYGVHFNQAMATLPNRKGTQIFVAFLWLYAIIFIVAYCSNLVAFLTFSRDPASIETFQKLQESRLRVLGIGSFFKTSMQEAGNMYLRALAERFYPYPTFDDAKSEILSGDAVMMDSRSVLEFHSAQIRTYRGRPLLRILKECFSPYNIGIAYQRNSPLKPQFDRTITALFESGLVRRWFLDSIELFRKIQDAKTNRLSFQADSDQESETGVIPLGMEHMLGIFIVYGFGVLFSAMLFVFERTFHQRL